MAQAQREQEYGQLQRQLGEREFVWLLQGLRRTSSAFARFASWRDVADFMREGGARDRRNDEVLRPIFEAHGADQDPRWRTVLLVLFWPALLSISRWKSRWDKDSEELWQNLTWTFLRVVCRIDLRRRPHGLGQKVLNDTVHRLWEEYRRQYGRDASEIPTDPEELDALIEGEEDIDYEGIGQRLAQEAELKRLRAHREAGRLSEEDYLLLVGTRVYGQSAAEYARERGLSCELARKRRLRAEAALRRHEGLESLSRSSRLDPPFLGGEA